MQDLVELTAIAVSCHFVVLWSQSSSKYVTVHGGNGLWIQTKIISLERLEVQSGTWNDNVYGSAYNELGCCPECGIIGIVSKVPRKNNLWDLCLNRLVIGHKVPDKLHCSFPFLPFRLSHDAVFFQIYKLVLLSDSSDCDKNICSRHKVVLQLGACICIFCLDIRPDADESVSIQNVCNLCPFDSHSFYTTPSILGHQLCFSVDCQLAACIVDGSFFAWNLETQELYGCSKNFYASADCIAVGYLFSIVYTSDNSTLSVISSVTGETILFLCINNVEGSPIFGPKDQQWLNCVDSLDVDYSLAISLLERYIPCSFYL